MTTTTAHSTHLTDNILTHKKAINSTLATTITKIGESIIAILRCASLGLDWSDEILCL